MTHPEIKRYANRPTVQTALADFREVWATKYEDASDWGKAVKRAEYRVNLAVENCIEPR